MTPVVTCPDLSCAPDLHFQLLDGPLYLDISKGDSIQYAPSGMNYLILHVFFLSPCSPNSLFPFTSSRMLGPSSISPASRVMGPCYRHASCISIPTTILVQALCNSLRDSCKWSLSLPISLLRAAERMVLQCLVKVAFHFLKDKIQPPEYGIH